MIFFGFATIFRRWSTRTVAIATLGFSFGIEISQLYHAAWIDSLRATRLGGLILGFGFLWSDLICYSVGVGISAMVDMYLGSVRYRVR
ncbi:hypothetical protein GCM10027592_38340 [Spirosoma flavus]